LHRRPRRGDGAPRRRALERGPLIATGFSSRCGTATASVKRLGLAVGKPAVAILEATFGALRSGGASWTSRYSRATPRKQRWNAPDHLFPSRWKPRRDT